MDDTQLLNKLTELVQDGAKVEIRSGKYNPNIFCIEITMIDSSFTAEERDLRKALEKV